MGEYLTFRRTPASAGAYYDVDLGGVAAAGGAPTIATATVPTSVRWEGQQTITLGGSGFDATVTAYADGTPLTTTYVSSSAATAILPRTYLWEAGPVAITAKNATTAASAAQTLTVTQPAYLHAAYRADKGRTMNGGTVQVLADQSGRGDANRNLTQLTAGAQPIYVAANAAYNNQDTFTLDGARWMQSGAWSVAPALPYRYYWVGEVTSSAASYMVEGRVGTNRSVLYGASGSANCYAGAANVLLGPSVATKHISCLDWNGAATKYARSAKTLTTASASPGTQTITGITLGAYVDGTVVMTGVFARCIIVDSTSITTAQHGEIMDYLGARYGITVAA